VKIGVFQAACGGASRDARLRRLAEALAANPVDFVVCPELFASGYNVGAELRSRAEPVDGSFNAVIASLAKATGAAILYGYPEAADGRLYNSAACVGPDGALLANHRKRLNSPGSFEEIYFSPSPGGTSFTYRGVKIAVLICFEIELSEPAREAALEGAQLIAAPSALVSQWEVVARRMIPTRAFENGVYLAYANHAGTENGFTYLGESRIVAPDGCEEAVAGAGEEMLVATFDAERVRAAQARMPYLANARRLIHPADLLGC
jgi:predicted amidohydrolase